MKTLGKLDEAAASCERALALKPDFADAYVNLGLARRAQGKLDEAAACYERALLLKPDDGNYRVNRTLLWLLQGNFEKGWAEYEWRWRRPTYPPRPFPQPLWQGEPLAGRTILLHAEQGFGDTLQLVRYVRLISGAGTLACRADKSVCPTVLLECPSPLVRLLSYSCGPDGQSGLGAVQVVANGEALPNFDVHAPFLSLPRLLGTTSLERIPASVPYLCCDPSLQLQWRTRIEELEARGEGVSRDATAERDTFPRSAVASRPTPSAVAHFRVGIVWQGSLTHKSDRQRSVTLERFAPLGRVPGVSLISLQKGPGSEQLAALPGLVDLGRELTDFADTAAALQSLDLIITVDTSVAHLAGGAGHGSLGGVALCRRLALAAGPRR